jgi:hypothetical protein
MNPRRGGTNLGVLARGGERTQCAPGQALGGASLHEDHAETILGPVVGIRLGLRIVEGMVTGERIGRRIGRLRTCSGHVLVGERRRVAENEPHGIAYPRVLSDDGLQAPVELRGDLAPLGGNVLCVLSQLSDKLERVGVHEAQVFSLGLVTQLDSDAQALVMDLRTRRLDRGITLSEEGCIRVGDLASGTRSLDLQVVSALGYLHGLLGVAAALFDCLDMGVSLGEVVAELLSLLVDVRAGEGEGLRERSAPGAPGAGRLGDDR